MKKRSEAFDNRNQSTKKTKTINNFVSGQDLSANKSNLDQLKSYDEFKFLFSKGENYIINFLTKNSQNFTAKSPNGSNLIHWASAYNMQSLVKYLFEKGFDLNATNNDGLTAVHYACAYNPNIEVIKYLVQNEKCDLNAKTPGGLDALHLACKYNPNIEVIKYLVETGFLLTEEDNNGVSAFHFACAYNHSLEVIKFACTYSTPVGVVKYLVVDLKATDIYGSNALHYACKYNPNIEVIKYLVETENFYPNETEKFGLNDTNFYGLNALHFACRYNTNIEVIKYLLEKGSDYSFCDKAGMTPFGYLLQKDKDIYDEVIKYWLADIENNIINVQSSEDTEVMLIAENTEENN